MDKNPEENRETGKGKIGSLFHRSKNAGSRRNEGGPVLPRQAKKNQNLCEPPIHEEPGFVQREGSQGKGGTKRSGIGEESLFPAVFSVRKKRGGERTSSPRSAIPDLNFRTPLTKGRGERKGGKGGATPCYSKRRNPVDRKNKTKPGKRQPPYMLHAKGAANATVSKTLYSMKGEGEKLF